MNQPPPQFRSRLSRRQFLGAGVAGTLAAGLGGAAKGVYAATTKSGHAPSGALGLGPGGKLLAPDTRPFPHVPAGTDMLPRLKHIIVLMMENHSFDDHLGMLGRGDGLTLGANGRPINYNPNPAGGFVRSFHNPNTVGYADNHIGQDWNVSHISWDHGTNMGFVEGCGPASMGYWTGEDLPFYYSLAKQFPIGDRYFSSVMAQTYPNRRFLIAGTALGNVATNVSGISVTDAPNGTIFDRLDHYGISWKDYYPDLPTCALFEPNFTRHEHDGKVVHFEQFLTDAKSGNLPAFSLIDPYVNYSEENNDISIGEAYAATMINAVLESPNWPNTALILNYDEHGGWYDHVSPVPAVRPDNVPPEINVPPDQPGGYDQTGFRVPCVVVSAWSKRNHVSHVVYDHTSVLKLVETKWNLPAMTYRDANAQNMLDFFDFFDFSGKRGPFHEPPHVAQPLNPFTGPLPQTSGHASDFHPIATTVAGSGPAAGAQVSSVPKNAARLIARHSQRALASTT